MTRVEVPTSFTSPTGHIDLNNDNIGYVESYDFSRAKKLTKTYYLVETLGYYVMIYVKQINLRSSLMSTEKKTHIAESEITPPTMLGRVELNNDNIGYVESWDFSRANLSDAHRKFYITKIASVCYSNEKAIGSISLYDRLACESASLPSSSFEFVPVLLPYNSVFVDEVIYFPTCWKYGELVDNCNKSVLDGQTQYLLTNLRALIADVGDRADQFFNTEEECAIIAKHHKVFKAKIDIATRTQYIS